MKLKLHTLLIYYFVHYLSRIFKKCNFSTANNFEIHVCIFMCIIGIIRTYFNLHHIINVHSYTFLRLFHLESPQIFMLDLLFSSVSGNLFFLFNYEFFDLELEYAMFSVNSKYSVVYKKWQRNILSLPSGGKGWLLSSTVIL